MYIVSLKNNYDLLEIKAMTRMELTSMLTPYKESIDMTNLRITNFMLEV